MWPSACETPENELGVAHVSLGSTRHGMVMVIQVPPDMAWLSYYSVSSLESAHFANLLLSVFVVKDKVT